VTKLGSELEELAALDAAHGKDALVAAMSRAIEFSRLRVADVRSILDAGTGVPRPTQAGQALLIDLPVAPGRPLADYAWEKAQ